MEIFDSSYYSINKRLLRIVGLWPYLSKTRKNVSLVVFSIVAFSLIVPIIAGFIRAWGHDIVEANENAIGSLYFLAIYSKYLSAYIFEDRIKLVYEQTARDWQSLDNKEEINILQKYSEQGRFLTILFVSYSMFAVCVFNGFPFVPFILDKLFPANESHTRVYPYQPNYFIIDDVKYFYELFLCHGCIVVAMTTAAAVAIDSMMVANIKHSCGLFAIVCYRLEQIGKIEKPEKYGEHSLANDDEVYYKAKKVCDMHRNSLNSVDRIQDSFSISFLIVMVSSMVATAMIMFDILFTLDVPIKLVICIVLLLGVKICILYINWSVQTIINSSEEVFTSAYYSDWYNLSINARKLIFIILQKSMKPCILTAGDIFELNLQMFAAVVKTSVSYVTVMLSMHGDKAIQ